MLNTKGAEYLTERRGSVCPQVESYLALSQGDNFLLYYLVRGSTLVNGRLLDQLVFRLQFEDRILMGKWRLPYLLLRHNCQCLYSSCRFMCTSVYQHVSVTDYKGVKYPCRLFGEFTILSFGIFRTQIRLMALIKSYKQCCGSITFWCGSRSADPCL